MAIAAAAITIAVFTTTMERAATMVQSETGATMEIAATKMTTAAATVTTTVLISGAAMAERAAAERGHAIAIVSTTTDEAARVQACS